MFIRQTPPNHPCEHIVHDSGIHEFIIGTLDSAGADAYLEQLELLFAQRHQTDPVLRMLLNCSGGTPPTNYILEHTRELFGKYPNIGQARHALLMQDPVTVRLIDSFVRLTQLPPDYKMRVFEANKSEQAFAWLLDG